MDNDSFHQLYKGESSSILVALLGSSLRMPKEGESDPDDGVYELTSSEFKTICDAIFEARKGSPYGFDTIESLLDDADEQGLAERWFRLSDAAFAWVMSKKPVSTFDCTIV